MNIKLTSQLQYWFEKWQYVTVRVLKRIKLIMSDYDYVNYVSRFNSKGYYNVSFIINDDLIILQLFLAKCIFYNINS